MIEQEPAAAPASSGLRPSSSPKIERHWSRGTLLCWMGLVLLIAASWEKFYFSVPFSSRERLAEQLTLLPYSKLPGLRGLLQQSDRLTKPGDVIVLAIPASRWDQGYEYAYARSLYPLAGRTVIPLVGESGGPDPRALGRADWVICLQSSIRAPGFALAESSSSGTIHRRVR